MVEDLIKRPDQVEYAMRELSVAFIDATVHAQAALALVKYVQGLESVTAAQAARIAELEAAIRKQANAARSLADATIRDASIRQGLAEKAYAESSPEVLASERQANAMLTEENERLTARLTALESERDALLNSLAAARQDASTAWERHAMATRIGNAAAGDLATARGRIVELEAERDALLAAAGKEAVAIAISTEKICEIAGKYDLGNPRLDALRGFVNEIIIVNGAEYAKSE